ncbi:MAG: 50S ribosomal protein L25 [Endomicrobia bacterium]|nr:50S ribosomal protein L25 [Endomicrobiia bacterium]
MKEVILETEVRETGSKSSLEAFRKQGKIPGTFYGKGVKPSNIAVNSRDFMTIIAENGANVIISLKLKDGKKPVIVKELQRNILTQAPIHVDFQAISLKEKIEVLVPIHIEGIADGVKNAGGVMEHIVREVRIAALPTNIPQKISLDVSALTIGKGLTIADLPKLEGVEYLQDPSTLVVNVVTVKVEEEKPAAEAAAAGTEPAQPEVISKGKKDKEGEEGAAAAGGAGAAKAAPAAGTKK